MKKLLTAVMVLLLVLPYVSANTLRWGSEMYYIKDYDLGDLPYSEDDGTVGAFRQLIWVGADGLVDAFVNSGTGITDDDWVVDVSYSYGKGIIGEWTNQFGYIATGFGAAESNNLYYARVYNAGNPDYASDTNAVIPVGATHYYESDTHAFAYQETGLDDDFDFSFGSDQQTLTLIPEPGTLALFGIGLLTIAARRRLRKRKR